MSKREDRLLTRAEQAAILGVAPATVGQYRMLYAKSVNPYPDGERNNRGEHVLLESELRAWMSRRPGKATGRPHAYRLPPQFKDQGLRYAAFRALHAAARGEDITASSARRLETAGYLRRTDEGYTLTTVGEQTVEAFPPPPDRVG